MPLSLVRTVEERTEVLASGIFSLAALTEMANVCLSHGRGFKLVTSSVRSAITVLGFIRRKVGPKNPELFSKLYKSIVRPILEYCSLVWCLHLKKDLNTLEKINRRASKCALGNTKICL